MRRWSHGIHSLCSEMTGSGVRLSTSDQQLVTLGSSKVTPLASDPELKHTSSPGIFYTQTATVRERGTLSSLEKVWLFRAVIYCKVRGQGEEDT